MGAKAHTKTLFILISKTDFLFADVAAADDDDAAVASGDDADDDDGSSFNEVSDDIADPDPSNSIQMLLLLYFLS